MLFRSAKQNKNIAVISDAGMPVISDPGQILIDKLIENNIEYTVVPGASASLSALLLSDIIKTYGADSYISRCACSIMGSSETIFYVSSVYFAGSRIKNITPAILVALVGNLFSAILSCLFCKII